MKKAKKPLTAEQKRIARNEYSRKWKKAHAKQVAKWNREWHEAQVKVAKKKKAKKVTKKIGKRTYKKEVAVHRKNENSRLVGNREAQKRAKAPVAVPQQQEVA